MLRRLRVHSARSPDKQSDLVTSVLHRLVDKLRVHAGCYISSIKS